MYGFGFYYYFECSVFLGLHHIKALRCFLFLLSNFMFYQATSGVTSILVQMLKFQEGSETVFSLTCFVISVNLTKEIKFIINQLCLLCPILKLYEPSAYSSLCSKYKFDSLY